MDSPRRWLPYDTFKLIVALILLILWIILMLQKTPTAAPSAVVATEKIPAAVAVLPSATPTLPMPSATPQPSATPIPPTNTPQPQPSPTALPTATPEAPTPTPAAAAEQPTPAPQAAQPAASGDCPNAQPARLTVGKQARVVTNLYARSAAGLENAVLKTNLPGATLDVLGGPVCTVVNGGAYLWWNVKSADGISGWSAEASLNTASYFLEPLP